MPILPVLRGHGGYAGADVHESKWGQVNRSALAFGEDIPMSTTVQAILVTALVFGIVVAIFGLIYLWEKWGKGTRLEQRIDRFFDRVSDMFDR